MSTTAITTPLLAINTLSNNLVDAGGGSANGIVATTPADGWVVSPPSTQAFDQERLIFKLVADGTGDTVTFVAGDRYPAQRPDLGNLALVLAASEARYVQVEVSRFLQNDGTILVTCVDTGTTLTALQLAKG